MYDSDGDQRKQSAAKGTPGLDCISVPLFHDACFALNVDNQAKAPNNTIIWTNKISHLITYTINHSETPSTERRTLIAGVLLSRITDHELKGEIIKTLQSVWFESAGKGKSEDDESDARVLDITTVLMSSAYTHQRAHFNTLLESV